MSVLVDCCSFLSTVSVFSVIDAYLRWHTLSLTKYINKVRLGNSKVNAEQLKFCLCITSFPFCSQADILGNVMSRMVCY